jgi:ADP-ribosylglycohydrolase
MEIVMADNMPKMFNAGRAVGAMLGAAFGDALGWPNERISKAKVSKQPQGRLQEFRKWTRITGGRFFSHDELIGAGDYSDDTQLILCMSRSLLHGDFWWDHFTRIELPFWTVYERGGGGATKRAANAWMDGAMPWAPRQKSQEVKSYFNAGGNGVAMRILPHIIFHKESNDFKPIATNVMRDGICTHGHPRALLGAIVYSYALWVSLKRESKLGYGELVEDLIANVKTWSAFPEHSILPMDWWDQANKALKDYSDVWESTKLEILEYLNVCRTEIAKGALCIDDEALKRIQCFNKQISGAGTVGAIAAVYLASRYAADPINGVIKAAFAIGSDTDTIASMSGGLLGCINGKDWLASVQNRIQDAGYLEKIVLKLISENKEKPTPCEAVKRTAIKKWLDNVVKIHDSGSVILPDGRKAIVHCAPDYIGQTGKYKVAFRQFIISDEQIIYIKKISKGMFTPEAAPLPQSQELNNDIYMPDSSKGEMLIYQTNDGRVKLDVRLENETIWLTQPLVAELFRTTQQNISQHIRNIFDEGELTPEATHKKSLSVRREGNRDVQRSLDFYNLDMIISVGYRVKSLIATRFRIWATQQLKEYIIKGFVINDERLKNPPVKDSAIPDYFNEMLARIRDIRASERRMYLRVKEIFAMAGDYDPTWSETTKFFSTIQNKLHFAATGMTAAELIHSRSNALHPNMGLTSWQKDEIRKTDITIAKNYLKKDEVDQLNRIVVMWLDFAEDQAKRRKQIFMKDWELKLDEFLKFNDRDVLTNAGHISKKDADFHAQSEYERFAEHRRKYKELAGHEESIKQLEEAFRQLSKEDDNP